MEVGRNLSSKFDSHSCQSLDDDEDEDEDRFVIALDNSDQDECYDKGSESQTAGEFSSSDSSAAAPSSNLHNPYTKFVMSPPVVEPVQHVDSSTPVSMVTTASKYAAFGPDGGSNMVYLKSLSSTSVKDLQMENRVCNSDTTQEPSTMISSHSGDIQEVPRVPSKVCSSPEIIKRLRTETLDYEKNKVSSFEVDCTTEMNVENCLMSKNSIDVKTVTANQTPSDLNRDRDTSNVFGSSDKNSQRSQDENISFSSSQPAEILNSSSLLNAKPLKSPPLHQTIFSIPKTTAVSSIESIKKTPPVSQTPSSINVPVSDGNSQTNCSTSTGNTSSIFKSENRFPVVFSKGNFFVVMPRSSIAPSSTVFMAPGTAPVPVVCRLIPQVVRGESRALVLTKNFIQSCKPDLRNLLKCVRKIDFSSPDRVYLYVNENAGNNLASPQKFNVVLKPVGNEQPLISCVATNSSNSSSISNHEDLSDVLSKLLNSHFSQNSAILSSTIKNAFGSNYQFFTTQHSTATNTASCSPPNLTSNFKPRSPFQNPNTVFTSGLSMMHATPQNSLPPPPPLLRCPTSASTQAKDNDPCKRDRVMVSDEPKETLVIPLQGHGTKRDELATQNAPGMVDASANDYIDLTSDIYTFSLPDEISPVKATDTDTGVSDVSEHNAYGDHTWERISLASNVSKTELSQAHTIEKGNSNPSQLAPLITVNLSSSANFTQSSSPSITSSRQYLNKVLERLLQVKGVSDDVTQNDSNVKMLSQKQKYLNGYVSRTSPSSFVPSILQRSPELSSSLRSLSQTQTSLRRPVNAATNHSLNDTTFSGQTLPSSGSSHAAQSCVSKSSSVLIPSTLSLQTSNATLPFTTFTTVNGTSKSSILSTSLSPSLLSSSLSLSSTPDVLSTPSYSPLSSCASSTSLSADGLKLKIRLKDVKDHGPAVKSKSKLGKNDESSVTPAVCSEYSKGSSLPCVDFGSGDKQLSSESILVSESTQSADKNPLCKPLETAEEMFQRFQEQAKQQVYNAQFGVGNLRRNLRRTDAARSLLSIQSNNYKKNRKSGFKNFNRHYLYPMPSRSHCTAKVNQQDGLKVVPKSTKKRHSSSSGKRYEDDILTKEPQLDINSFPNLREDTNSILMKKNVFTPNIMAAHKVFVNFNVFSNMQSERCFLIPFFNLGGSRVQFDCEDMDYIKKAVVEVEKEEKFCARHLLYYTREYNKAVFVRKENLNHNIEVNDKSYKKCSYILKGFSRESAVSKSKSVLEPAQWKVDKKVSIEIDRAECDNSVAINFEEKAADSIGSKALRVSCHSIKDEATKLNSDHSKKEIEPGQIRNEALRLESKAERFNNFEQEPMEEDIDGDDEDDSCQGSGYNWNKPLGTKLDHISNEERGDMQNASEVCGNSSGKGITFFPDSDGFIEKTFMIRGNVIKSNTSALHITNVGNGKENGNYSNSNDGSNPPIRNNTKKDLGPGNACSTDFTPNERCKNISPLKSRSEVQSPNLFYDNPKDIQSKEAAVDSETTYTDQLKELFASGGLQKSIPSVSESLCLEDRESEKDKSRVDNIKADTPLDIPIKSEKVDEEYEQYSQTSSIQNSEFMASEVMSSVKESVKDVSIKSEPLDEYFDSLEQSCGQTETPIYQSVENGENLAATASCGEEEKEELEESLKKDSLGNDTMQELSEETMSAFSNSPRTTVLDSSETSSSSSFESSDEEDCEDTGEEIIAEPCDNAICESTPSASFPSLGTDSLEPSLGALATSVNTKITSLVESLKQRLNDKNTIAPPLPSIYTECVNQRREKFKKKKRKRHTNELKESNKQPDLLTSSQTLLPSTFEKLDGVSQVVCSSTVSSNSISTVSATSAVATSMTKSLTNTCMSGGLVQSHVTNSTAVGSIPSTSFHQIASSVECASTTLSMSGGTQGGVCSSSMPTLPAPSIPHPETGHLSNDDFRQRFPFITAKVSSRSLKDNAVLSEQQTIDPLQDNHPSESVPKEIPKITSVPGSHNDFTQSNTEKPSELLPNAKQVSSLLSCTTHADSSTPEFDRDNDSGSDIDVGTECFIPETPKSQACVARWLLSSPPLSAQGKSHIKDFTRENEFLSPSKKKSNPNLPSHLGNTEGNLKAGGEGDDKVSPKKFALPLRPRTAVGKKKVKSPKMASSLSVASKLCEKLDITVTPLAPKLMGKIVTPMECSSIIEVPPPPPLPFSPEGISPSPSLSVIPKRIDPTFKPSINAIFGVENVPKSVVGEVDTNTPDQNISATESVAFKTMTGRTQRQVAKKGIAKLPHVNGENKKDKIKTSGVCTPSESCKVQKRKVAQRKPSVVIEKEKSQSPDLKIEVCGKDVRVKIAQESERNVQNKKGVNTASSEVVKDDSSKELEELKTTRDPHLEFGIKQCKVCLQRLENMDWGKQGQPTVTASGSYIFKEDVKEGKKPKTVETVRDKRKISAVNVRRNRAQFGEPTVVGSVSDSVKELNEEKKWKTVKGAKRENKKCAPRRAGKQTKESTVTPPGTESGSECVKDVDKEKKPVISAETARKRKKKSVLRRTKKGRQQVVKPKKDIVDYYAAAIESLRKKALMLKQDEMKKEEEQLNKRKVDLELEVEDTTMEAALSEGIQTNSNPPMGGEIKQEEKEENMSKLADQDSIITLDECENLESKSTTALDQSEHVQAKSTIACEGSENAEPKSTTALDGNEHVEAKSTIAFDGSENMESKSTTACDGSEHVEPKSTTALDGNEHVGAKSTIAFDGSENMESKSTTACDGSEHVGSKSTTACDGSEHVGSNSTSLENENGGNVNEAKDAIEQTNEDVWDKLNCVMGADEVLGDGVLGNSQQSAKSGDKKGVVSEVMNYSNDNAPLISHNLEEDAFSLEKNKEHAPEKAPENTSECQSSEDNKNLKNLQDNLDKNAVDLLKELENPGYPENKESAFEKKDGTPLFDHLQDTVTSGAECQDIPCSFDSAGSGHGTRTAYSNENKDSSSDKKHDTFSTDKKIVDSASEHDRSYRKTNEGIVSQSSTSSVIGISDECDTNTDTAGSIFPNKDIVLGFEDELGADTILSKLGAGDDDDMFLLDDEEDAGSIGLIPDDEVEKLLGLDMKDKTDESCAGLGQKKPEPLSQLGEKESKLHWNTIPVAGNDKIGNTEQQMMPAVDGINNQRPQIQNLGLLQVQVENNEDGEVKRNQSVLEIPGSTKENQPSSADCWQRLDHGNVSPERAPGNGDTDTNKSMNVSPSWKRILGMQALKEIEDSVTHAIAATVGAKNGSTKDDKHLAGTKKPVIQRDKLKLCTGALSKAFKLSAEMRKNFGDSSTSTEKEKKEVEKLPGTKSFDGLKHPLGRKRSPSPTGHGNILSSTSSENDTGDSKSDRTAASRMMNSNTNSSVELVEQRKSECIYNSDRLEDNTQTAKSAEVVNLLMKNSNVKPKESPKPSQKNKMIDLTKLKMKLTPILAAGKMKPIKNNVQRSEGPYNSLSCPSISEVKGHEISGSCIQSPSLNGFNEQAISSGDNSSGPIGEKKEIKKTIFPPVLNTTKLSNILKNLKTPASLNLSSKQVDSPQQTAIPRDPQLSHVLPESSNESESRPSVRKRTRSIQQNSRDGKCTESKRLRKSLIDRSPSEIESRTREKSVEQEDKGERSCFDCLSGFSKDLWESQ